MTPWAGAARSAQPSSARRSASADAPGRLLATAAAAVESFFLDSAAPEPAAEGAGPIEIRPVVCVVGLARSCGVTVVARALAAELASRDPGGAAAVCCDARPGGIPLATRSATALARVLDDIPGAAPRALGRLCLAGGKEPGGPAGGSDRGRLAGGSDLGRLVDTARHHAPVVIDAGAEAIGSASASLADRTVIVTTRDVEPALVRVATECVGRIGSPPVVVLNRSPHDQPGLFPLPNSPLGARLALGGREPRGELGRAIAELADMCEA